MEKIKKMLEEIDGKEVTLDEAFDNMKKILKEYHKIKENENQLELDFENEQ